MPVTLTRLCSFATLLILSAFLLACSSTPEANTNIANTNAATPTPASTPNAANSKYEGFLDSADCSTVWGWAWDKTQKPNDVVYVEILAGGVPIATVPASGARWSVAERTKDAGYHGFTYTVHPTLKNGKPQVISARIATTDYELFGSPKTITCKP